MQHPDASGQGISRNQLQVSSLEDIIATDNPVRFSDAFVNSIDLVTNGIAIAFRRHLHTIFIFDQQGPPAWYLGDSKNSSSYKS
ncbi:MAG: hypothetical protein IM568_06165 [Flavobacterium sp.]|nr:hypothetical protein [Flavobacterium sp.]